MDYTNNGVLTITVGGVNEPPTLSLTSAHQRKIFTAVSQASASFGYNLVSVNDPEDTFSCVYEILGIYNNVFKVVSTTGRAVIVLLQRRV